MVPTAVGHAGAGATSHAGVHHDVLHRCPIADAPYCVWSPMSSRLGKVRTRAHCGDVPSRPCPWGRQERRRDASRRARSTGAVTCAPRQCILPLRAVKSRLKSSPPPAFPAGPCRGPGARRPCVLSGTHIDRPVQSAPCRVTPAGAPLSPAAAACWGSRRRGEPAAVAGGGGPEASGGRGGATMPLILPIRRQVLFHLIGLMTKKAHEEKRANL